LMLALGILQRSAEIYFGNPLMYMGGRWSSSDRPALAKTGLV